MRLLPVLVLASLAGLGQARLASAQNTPPTVNIGTPITFTLTQGAFTTQVQAVERAMSAAAFYNYFSASSHTGFEVPFQSKMFLYRDTTTGLLSLFFTHNIDFSVTGIPTGPSSVYFDLTGVPPAAFVAQSDDPFQGGRPELSLSLEPEGHWDYNDNTDGGVIDGLPTDGSWCITIDPLLFMNITSWVYHYASGAQIPLAMNLPVTICFVPPVDVNVLDVDEGNVASLSGFFDDPDAADTHVATWDLGDGSSTPAPFTPGPGATHHDCLPVFHVYGDDGDFTAILGVDDSAGGHGEDTLTVRVHNVAPTASLLGPYFTSIGNTLALTAQASDPGSDDLSFTWDFGDGSPTVTNDHFNDGISPDPDPSAPGVFPFTAVDAVTHVWCEPGDFTVSIVVSDDDGGSDSLATVAHVAATPVGPECNEPPSCGAGGPYASLCHTAAVDGATVTDPDGDALDYVWTSDRGDVTISPASGTILGSTGAGASVPAATATLDAATAPCGVVAHLTLRVTDPTGATSTCETDVTFNDPESPTLSVPSPLVLECSGPGGTPSSNPTISAWLGSATASDGCSGAITPTNDAPPVIPDGCPGTTVVTFTARDACGNAATATSSITIEDTVRPTVLVPAALVLECTGRGGVPSSDARVQAWLAGASASDTCDGPLVPANDVPAVIPGACTGATIVTFTAVDACGNVGTATATVTVVDTTPPTVSASGGPIACLWPPNHSYVAIPVSDLAATATDDCSDVTVEVLGCVSDQPDDAPESGSPWNGDGNTVDDCVLSPDHHTLYVRAERCGTGPTAQDGRHYGIEVVAVDACGNRSAAAVAGSIHVPHDQSPHERSGCLDPTKVGTRHLP